MKHVIMSKGSFLISTIPAEANEVLIEIGATSLPSMRGKPTSILHYVKIMTDKGKFDVPLELLSPKQIEAIHTQIREKHQ